MKRFYQAGILAALFGLAAPAVHADLGEGDMLYGSYDLSAAEDSWGITDGYTYTYDVAYLLPPSLAGKTLRGVSVPFRNTDGLTAMKGWASEKLSAVNFQPDTRSKEFTADCSELAFTDVIFDTPVVIPENGIYIGYSFTTVRAETFDQLNPVVISTPLIMNKEMLRFHVEGIGWQDYTSNSSNTEFLTAGILAIIGDNTDKNMVSVEEPDIISCDVSSISLPLVIRNEGWDGVSSISYKLDIDGTVSEGDISFTDVDLIKSMRQYYIAQKIEVPVESKFNAGRYPYTFEITKVNGETNPSAGKATSGELRLLQNMPKRIPLIEEGTSLSCTWCPRGYYAIEVTNRLEPDAITIVYHTGQMGYTDPMIAIESAPWINGGLPTMIMDRAVNPESAADKVSAGLIPAWNERSKVYSPASISASAEWLDRNYTQIGVTTNFWFAENVTNGNYKLEFALLADDLYDATGTNPNWRQKNSYSGEKGLFTEEEWNVFANGSDYVSGLHFNNVFVLGGTENMAGIPNSVPKQITAYEPQTYMHIFDLTQARQLKADGSRGNSIIQNRNNLRVVAFMVNNRGEVVNAAKCVVPLVAPGYEGPISGIIGVDADDSTWPEVYYDMTGREIDNPSAGVYIVRLANGKCEKRVIR